MPEDEDNRVARVVRAAVQSSETGKETENLIHFYPAGKSVAALGRMREQDAKEMVSYLAQQLNTPLYKLLETCKSLSQEIPTEEKAAELLKQIQTAVKATG